MMPIGMLIMQGMGDWIDASSFPCGR
jgi:hypothetical protein